MRPAALTPWQALWILCTFALLAPHAAAADQRLAIDFDGDGRHDRVTLDRREPSVLHVWLSASNTRHVIRSGAPLLRLVASDLDGDDRPELIARDNQSRIHVWTPRHHGVGLKRYRARSTAPGLLTHPEKHRVDDTDNEEPAAITGTTSALFALTLHASPIALTLEASHASSPQPPPARGSFTATDPFAPRPPPTRIPL